jgi:hypothetical protein
MTAGTRLRPDPLRLALGLWLVVGIAVSVRTLVSPFKHSVFPIFAASVARWWADRPMYDFYPPLDIFRYPPFFAVAATPFGVLGLRIGGILWGWVSLAVLLGGLWCFARDVAPGRWTRPRLAGFLALAAVGALRGLWNNQSNALIVGLLLLAASALARAVGAAVVGQASRLQPRSRDGCTATAVVGQASRLQPRSRDGCTATAARSRRWWRAALLLAAAVCLKLTPLAPALLLCALWPRRLGWRFALAVAIGFLVPFLTRPPAEVLSQYAGWLDHLQQSTGERWRGFRDGWTFWLAARHLAAGLPMNFEITHPIDTPAYRLVQVLSAPAVLAWCLWQRRRGRRLGLGDGWVVHVALAAGLAWLMLFGPAVEHATYVFLAPPLLWAVVQREAWVRGRGLLMAAFVLVMVLGWGVVAREGMEAWPSGGPLLLAALPLGSLLFLLWLAGYALACGPRPDRDAVPPFWDERPEKDEWATLIEGVRPSRPRERPSVTAA